MNRKIVHPVRFVLIVGACMALIGEILPSANDSANTVNGLVEAAVIIAAYFAPTIVARSRHHHQLGAIAVINTLLGITGIGWVVALAMACSAVHDPKQVRD